jgi:hypothetical protein
VLVVSVAVNVLPLQRLEPSGDLLMPPQLSQGEIADSIEVAGHTYFAGNSAIRWPILCPLKVGYENMPSFRERQTTLWPMMLNF